MLPEASADADAAVDEADSVEKVETEYDSADTAELPEDSVVDDGTAETTVEELSNEYGNDEVNVEDGVEDTRDDAEVEDTTVVCTVTD